MAEYDADTGLVRTDSGRVVDLEALAAEAERGYDVTRLVGRPTLGRGVAVVVPVRFPPELKDAVDARAEGESTSVSEIVRAAVREYLA